MKAPSVPSVIMAMILCGGGCTVCDVKKVDPNAPAALAPPGVRYSLPKPFLQVTPAGDGSVSVNVVYLPDPNNTYAVNAQSYMAAHTLEVALDNSGVLTKVNFAPDTSAAASQAATSAGNVASSFESAASQQASAEQTKTAAAQQAVQQAQATVNQDQAKLDEIRQLNAAGAKPPIDENQPQIDLAAAQAALKSAQQALARLTAAGGNAGGGGAAAAGAPGARPAYWVNVYGPVLYSIDAQPNGGVSLTPVQISGAAQAQYDTTTRPTASDAPTLSAPPTISLGGNPNAQFDITSSKPITAVNPANSGLVLAAPPAPPVSKPLPTLTLVNSNQIHVAMNPAVVGNYRLSINFSYPDSANNSQSTTATVSFQIVP